MAASKGALPPTRFSMADRLQNIPLVDEANMPLPQHKTVLPSCEECLKTAFAVDSELANHKEELEWSHHKALAFATQALQAKASSNGFLDPMLLGPVPGVGCISTTLDDMAALHMLLQETVLWRVLNARARSADPDQRKRLADLFNLLVRGILGLSKIPGTFYLGARRDLRAYFPTGSTRTWWAFVSVTESLDVLNSLVFSGQTGSDSEYQTVLEISNALVADVSGLVGLPHERECLLYPGTQVRVTSITSSNPKSSGPVRHTIKLVQIHDGEDQEESLPTNTSSQTASVCVCVCVCVCVSLVGWLL
jgi:hypothetical protein